MDTVKFIRELLYDHDCVIVPGFGALIGNYVPAHFDRVRQVFHPPSRQISYNKRLDHNDGLLSGAISRDMMINYTDARSIVDQFVAGINKTLSRGESVKWEGVGTFIPGKPDTIIFEQESSVNMLVDSYGLMAFHFQGLREREEARRNEKRIRGIDIQRNDLKKRKYVLAAFIGIPILVAAIAFATFGTRSVTSYRVEASSLNPFSSVVRSITEQPSEINEKSPSDSTNEVEASLRGMTEKKAALYYEEAREIAPIGEKPSEIYHLIAGSFRSHENALHLKQEMDARGFSSEILTSGPGLFRVSLLFFTDRDLAVNELYRMRAMKDFEEVWLLTQ